MFKLCYKIYFNKKRYAKTCSRRCASLNPTRKQKQTNTLLKKYGVDHFSKTEQFKQIHASLPDEVKKNRVEKTKQTNIRKYGVSTNLIHINNIIKAKNTLLKKYGVDHFSKTEQFKQIHASLPDEVKKNRVEKTKQTNACKTEEQLLEIKQKIKQTMFERYQGYTLQSPILSKKVWDTINIIKNNDPLYQQKINEKRKNTCLERYNVDHFSKTEQFLIQYSNTIKQRYNFEHPNREHWTDTTFQLLNNKDWLYEQHVILKRPIYAIAAELNVDDTTVNKALQSFEIPISTCHMTSYAEQQIFDLIKNVAPELEVFRNYRIDGKEFDLVIPSKNIAIEYCGLFWHSDRWARIRSTYHKNKLLIANANKFQLITIFEDEWLERRSIVERMILHKIGLSNEQKINARSCEITIVGPKEKRQFFETNHIQGNGPSSINIGLTYAGQLVSVAGLIRRQNELIINRFASSCNVRGGFSKILAYIQQHYRKIPIITFADLRWSDGKLYTQTGFKCVDILPPDYSYVIDSKRFHKFAFRRKYLQNKLNTFDPKLSEVENCKRNNIFRIWNCGLKKFVKFPE